MRLKSITIKNFRSIDNIENFELLDRKITSFIGKNGSGKTNILRAVHALQDLKFLDDDYFFEKPNKNNETTIVGNFVFDPSDEQLLIDQGIKKSEIEGFRVTVSKRLGENATQTIIPITFKRDILSEFSMSVDKLLSKISKFIPNENDNISPNPQQIESPQTDEEAKPTEENPFLKVFTDFDAKWKDLDIANKIQLKQDTLSLIDEINKFIEQNNDKFDQEFKEGLNKLIFDIKGLVAFDINVILTNLFKEKLRINLLGFRDYPIESNAKYIDLEKGAGHLFIKDLIKLSDKKLEDFREKGSLLINNLKDATETLNRRLSEVFKQYSLQLEISAQKDELVFVFKTPQGRVRELLDLSDGETWFLQFYTKLAIAQKENSQVIWLFDEPGQNLNSTGQIDLKKYFDEISETSQILYTSHQPVMIQWHILERIFSVKNDKSIGTTIESRFWKDGEAESPVKDLLGLFVGEQILTGNEQIVVEGISDYIHLQAWLRFLQNNRTAKYSTENYCLLKRTIVPAQGFPTIPLYLLFLANKSRSKISTIALADNLEAGASMILQGISDSQIFTMEEAVRNIVQDNNRKIVGIEDLYTPDEFLIEAQKFLTENINLPNLKINSDFLKYAKAKLKDGIVSYIEKYLNEENPNYFEDNREIKLDKTGIAMQIYKKLIYPESSGMDKNTENIFAEIFKKLDTYFE